MNRGWVKHGMISLLAIASQLCITTRSELGSGDSKTASPPISFLLICPPFSTKLSRACLAVSSACTQHSLSLSTNCGGAKIQKGLVTSSQGEIQNNPNPTSCCAAVRPPHKIYTWPSYLTPYPSRPHPPTPLLPRITP